MGTTRHIAAGFVIALGAAACGNPEAEVCGPRLDDGTERAVFAQLTANEWSSGCHSGDPVGPPCRRLRLRADGSMSWTEVSDYTERDQRGEWNFRARDARSGVVCLDDGSVLAYELGDGTLAIGSRAFHAGEPIARDGERDDLPAVEASDLFLALTSRTWRKTSSFDLVYRPEQFTLSRDGTFTASYRGGECEHGGRFSLDHGEETSARGEAMLTPVSDPNTCDVRREPTAASIAASNDRPIVEGDELMLAIGDTYRDAASSATTQTFAFTSYGRGESLLVRGTFDEPLAPAVWTAITLRIENESPRAHRLVALRVSMQPLTSDLSIDGAPIEYENIDLTGTTLGPGDSRPFDVTVAPPSSGTFMLDFEVTSMDDRQPWTNRGSYLLRL